MGRGSTTAPCFRVSLPFLLPWPPVPSPFDCPSLFAPLLSSAIPRLPPPSPASRVDVARRRMASAGTLPPPLPRAPTRAAAGTGPHRRAASGPRTRFPPARARLPGGATSPFRRNGTSSPCSPAGKRGGRGGRGGGRRAQARSELRGRGAPRRRASAREEIDSRAARSAKPARRPRAADRCSVGRAARSISMRSRGKKKRPTAQRGDAARGALAALWRVCSVTRRRALEARSAGIRSRPRAAAWRCLGTGPFPALFCPADSSTRVFVSV